MNTLNKIEQVREAAHEPFTPGISSDVNTATGLHEVARDDVFRAQHNQEILWNLHGFAMRGENAFAVKSAAPRLHDDIPQVIIVRFRDNSFSTRYLDSLKPQELGDAKKIAEAEVRRFETGKIENSKPNVVRWVTYTFPEYVLDAEKKNHSELYHNSGQLMARCVSARENHQAAEAYVKTSITFARQGYGSMATQAWAQDMHQMQKTPFFSTSVANQGSLGIVRKLGLQFQFEETRIFANK